MKNESQSLSIGIFADLIGLQDLPSRGQLLGRLRMLMDKINTTFRDTIKVDFMIITDTEFKAAVDRSFPMQDFLALYEEEFGKDVGTHIGIGLGALGSPQEKEPGGCFYAARGAMTQARKTGQYIVFQGFEVNEAINALFYFIHEMNEAMTERQRKIIDVYRKSGDIVSVASELYLPKQAVFDSIKAAKYDVYSAAWRGLQELLKLDIQLPAPAGDRQRQQQPYQQQQQSAYRGKGYQRESARGRRDREAGRGRRDHEGDREAAGRTYRGREGDRTSRDHEAGRGHEQGRSHKSASGYRSARGESHRPGRPGPKSPRSNKPRPNKPGGQKKARHPRNPQ
ncbi:MAG: hypothetical protein AB1611_20680 [bacterium]